jgi:hypothetical protein
MRCGRQQVAVAIATLVATPACTRGGAESGDGSADDAGIDSFVNPYGGADSAPGDNVVHTYAPTYSAVWNEILLHDCALEFCHGGSADYLQLSSEAIGFQSLVGAPAEGPLCSKTGLLRVDPFHPETSLMYLKITTPPCGSKMPLGYGAPVVLDSRELDQIRAWIACGALDGDAGCLPEGGLDADVADATATEADATVADAADASPE